MNLREHLAQLAERAAARPFQPKVRRDDPPGKRITSIKEVADEKLREVLKDGLEESARTRGKQ